MKCLILCLRFARPVCHTSLRKSSVKRVQYDPAITYRSRHQFNFKLAASAYLTQMPNWIVIEPCTNFQVFISESDWKETNHAQLAFCIFSFFRSNNFVGSIISEPRKNKELNNDTISIGEKSDMGISWDDDTWSENKSKSHRKKLFQILNQCTCIWSNLQPLSIK